MARERLEDDILEIIFRSLTAVAALLTAQAHSSADTAHDMSIPTPPIDKDWVTAFFSIGTEDVMPNFDAIEWGCSDDGWSNHTDAHLPGACNHTYDTGIGECMA